MNEPSLFLLRVDSGDFKLHMSEFATQQGLQLFDPTVSFQVQDAYFDELVDPDGQAKRKLLQAKTVGDAVIALDESWPFDFSCLIDHQSAALIASRLRSITKQCVCFGQADTCSATVHVWQHRATSVFFRCIVFLDCKNAYHGP